jgi:hypothetical protein
VSSGSASVGGQANIPKDPGGTSNPSNQASAPPPGTNNAGTAQSSGASSNSSPGMTTGSAGPNAAGTDAAVAAEDRMIDRKIKGICRGC